MVDIIKGEIDSCGILHAGVAVGPAEVQPRPDDARDRAAQQVFFRAARYVQRLKIVHASYRTSVCSFTVYG